ncbi:MAG: KamA family radical SAM protein [Candidatus Cloacimonetes bacterium]|nr:KamA family radical SAM protein [Candidatus Cloacimonadota bacterium]MBL7086125.1 KamA family radical SAM protein [Candidatus Cloacimonadota bacterium]
MIWQKEFKNNITSIEQLKEYIQLSQKEVKQLKKVVERHPMRVSKYYLSLIDWDDPYDPLKKMVIPSIEELNLSGSYDTSGEQENTKLIGLQHKYSQTALILVTNRCASYCRFCFRKRMIGLPSEEILHKFSIAVKYIEEHKEINNVLISGGDPFVLSTRIIAKFLEKLSYIPHLNFIRFGSKVPVYLPNRIIEDEELGKLFKKYSLPDRRIYVVTQIDHPREITTQSIFAINKLLKSGVILNNQTVLMKGVNDDPNILAELQNRLVSIGINPYYVFQCRPVKRVKQFFQVPLYKGYEIVEQAKRKLNGHSKRFRYVMSHRTGKIEIVGIVGDEIYFKYHQAKDPRNYGKFFKRRLNKTAGWLDELSLKEL